MFIYIFIQKIFSRENRPATTKDVPTKASMIVLNLGFKSLSARDTTLHMQVAMHSTSAPIIADT